MKGKTKCYYHGGKSTGPKTVEGRNKIAAANTSHGRETRVKRARRKQTLKRLALIYDIAKIIKIIK